MEVFLRVQCFHSLLRKQKNDFFDSRKKVQDVRREEVHITLVIIKYHSKEIRTLHRANSCTFSGCCTVMYSTFVQNLCNK